VDLVSDIVSIAALAVSIFAYRHASKALRLGYRPVVRVVGAFAPQIGFLGGGHGQGISPPELELDRVILKNVGRGPALTVVAFDPENAALIGDVDVVEPLGAGEDEASRAGRVTLPFRRRMATGNDYHLYYQDTLGGWHLTRFRPKAEKIECTFDGEVKKVPGEIESLGTVLRP
jgi:hypothetical protein